MDMTLTDKTQLVLEVLRGADIAAVAKSQHLQTRTLNRWVQSFLRAGIAALCREEGGAEDRLAAVIPLFPDRNPTRKRQRSAHRGGR
jgi:hypothetical protein